MKRSGDDGIPGRQVKRPPSDLLAGAVPIIPASGPPAVRSAQGHVDRPMSPRRNRPAGYRGEMGMSDPSSTPSRGSARRVTVDDCVAYLRAMKQILKDKYDDFLEVFRDFKAGRTDTAGVVARVKVLLDGHSGLIPGFNAFLPEGFAIPLPGKDEGPVPKEELVAAMIQMFQEFKEVAIV